MYRDQEHEETKKRSREFRVWLAQAVFCTLIGFSFGVAAETGAHLAFCPHPAAAAEVAPVHVEPQPGALVRLRSGGPVMTLGEVEYVTGTAYCVRWCDYQYVHETFNVSALEVVE